MKSMFMPMPSSPFSSSPPVPARTPKRGGIQVQSSGRAAPSIEGDMTPSPGPAATVPDGEENSSGDKPTGTATSSPPTLFSLAILGNKLGTSQDVTDNSSNVKEAKA
ncbi:hypothetical protein AAFF_G00291940 [Aldrovandia affinis]|uniref:Uncharacterized protein n=1 Tax=Aldrovandia affinis TaxID=143900 RepID=A0AAD7WS20_9TELE|nr:hypothetical protein AAFF_G00291940 [Aldrovandia affinis]